MLYPGLKRGLRPLAPSGRRALNTHEAPAYSRRLSRLRQGFVGQAEAPSVLLIRYPPRVPCTSRVRVKSAKHVLMLREKCAHLLSRCSSGLTPKSRSGKGQSGGFGRLGAMFVKNADLSQYYIAV